MKRKQNANSQGYGGMYPPMIMPRYRENVTRDIKTDFWLVVLQGAAAPVALVCIVAGLIGITVFLGPIMWAVLLCVLSFVTFVKLIFQFEIGEAVEIQDIVVGFGIPALGAVAGLMWWKVCDWLIPLPELHYHRNLSLFTICWLTFWTWFFLHIQTRFGQEMATSSGEQERYIWQALGSLLELYGQMRMSRRRNNQRSMPIVTSHSAPLPPEVQEHDVTAASQLTRLELMLYKMRDNDGSFTRDVLCGSPLMDGSMLGQKERKDLLDGLVRLGYLKEKGRSYEWADGASPDLVINRVRHDRPTPQDDG